MGDENGNLQQTPPEAEAQAEASSEVTTTKSTDEIVKEMVAGQWGRGQVRRARLEAAGVDVDAAEKAYRKVITQR